MAIILSRLGVFEAILSQSKEVRFLGMFIAGLFYTSVLTIGPATVAIAEIADYNSVFLVAAIGALGAVIGDLALFAYVREEIASDLIVLLKKSVILSAFRWLAPLLGFLVIASPLPDEIGLAMMGLSNIKMSKFIPLSYLANFLGILAVAGVFHTLF